MIFSVRRALRPASLFRSMLTLAAISALSLTLTATADQTTDAQAAPAVMRAARAFTGTPPVGALFIDLSGRLQHFCTAAVVRSRAGNLLITAAHCLSGKRIRLGPGGNVSFAPRYHNGVFPYGRWPVMREYVDSNWARYHDPNDDFALLVVGAPGQRIQKLTGAETLETGQKMPRLVQVVGYPDGTQMPVTCTAPADYFDPGSYRQLIFRCGGYTGGTSGGPFLTDIRGRAQTGEVVGVIGGYQQGGDYANISYSSQFRSSVAALYKIAN